MSTAALSERPAADAAALGRAAPQPARVLSVRRETHDTFTLEIEVRGRRPFPAFGAGQFNMLYAFGAGEVPISISGSPAQPATIVHTIREVGGVTRALRALRPGDHLGIRGPFGTAWPVAPAERGRDMVIVAGGIGLAPLRPTLYELTARRGDFGRIALLYGARTPKDILYREELKAWRSRLDLDVEVTVDRAEPSWRGHVGVVTTLIERAAFDPGTTTALVCGPEVMMRFTVLNLRGRGVPEACIFVSLERNMKCAIGACGHCQVGPFFVCKDGPVFRYDRVKRWFETREV